MKECKPGIYSGPKQRSDGRFDPNVMLIKTISRQTEDMLYGEVTTIDNSGNWERNISTIDTDTMIAPWVLSKWS